MTIDLSGVPITSGEPTKIPGIFAAAFASVLDEETLIINGAWIDDAEYPSIEVDFVPGALNYTATAEAGDSVVTLAVTPADMLTATVTNPIPPVVYETLNATANGEYTPPEGVAAFDRVIVAVSGLVLTPDMSQSNLITSNASGVISAGAGKSVAIIDLGEGGGTAAAMYGVTGGSMSLVRFGSCNTYPAPGVRLTWFPTASQRTMRYCSGQGLCMLCAKTTDRYIYYETDYNAAFWARWTDTNPMEF